MAYVIHKHEVCDMSEFYDRLGVTRHVTDFMYYLDEQSDLIRERDEFARWNHDGHTIYPDHGFPYPEIPEQPFVFPLQGVIERLPEIFRNPNLINVNARARAALERVEPGVHRYIPIRYVNPAGGPELEPYWMVNICSRLVATDLERSNVKVKEVLDRRDLPDGRYTKFFGKKIPGGNTPKKDHMVLTLKKDVLAGRAIWYEWKLGYGFLTDAFIAALEADGIEHGYAHNAFHAEEF